MVGVFSILLLVLGVALDCNCEYYPLGVPEIATSPLSNEIFGKPIENDYQPRENAIREATFGKVPKKFYTEMKNEVFEDHQDIPEQPFNLQNDMLVNPDQPNYNNDFWTSGAPHFLQRPIFKNYFQRYPDFGVQTYPGLQDRSFMMKRIIRGMIQDLRRLIYRLPGRLQLKLLSPEPLESTRPARMIAADDFPRFRNIPDFLPIRQSFPNFLAPNFQPNNFPDSRNYPEPNFGISAAFHQRPALKRSFPNFPEPKTFLEAPPPASTFIRFPDPGNFQPNNFLDRRGFPEPLVFKPMLPEPRNALEFNSQPNSLGSSNFQEPNYQPNNFLERRGFPEPLVFKPMLPEPRNSLEFNSQPNSLGSSNFQEPNYQHSNFLERRGFPEPPVFKPMLPEPRNSPEFNSQPNSLGSSNFQEPNFQVKSFSGFKNDLKLNVASNLPYPGAFAGSPEPKRSAPNFPESQNSFQAPPRFPETPVLISTFPVFSEAQPGNIFNSRNVPEPRFQMDNSLGSRDSPRLATFEPYSPKAQNFPEIDQQIRNKYENFGKPVVSESEPPSANNKFEGFENTANNPGNAGAERNNFGGSNQFLEIPKILSNDIPQSRGL